MRQIIEYLWAQRSGMVLHEAEWDFVVPVMLEAHGDMWIPEVTLQAFFQALPNQWGYRRSAAVEASFETNFEEVMRDKDAVQAKFLEAVKSLKSQMEEALAA